MDCIPVINAYELYFDGGYIDYVYGGLAEANCWEQQSSIGGSNAGHKILGWEQSGCTGGGPPTPATDIPAGSGVLTNLYVDNLNYGTVAINEWAAIGYIIPQLPWGGFHVNRAVSYTHLTLPTIYSV